MSVSPTIAATKTWDGGGSGSSWGTANNWSSNGVPGTNDNVIFDADTANNKFSITLGGNRSITGVTFGATNLNSAFTLSNNTLTITSTGVTNNDNLNQTFASAVTISSAAQTFNAASGDLTFNAVTLSQNLTLSGNSNITLGSAGGTLTNSGANRTLTINTGGSRTIGAINLSNNATSRTLTITGSGNATVTGVIANGGTAASGNLTKSGNGTLTLSGSNTYSGNTTLSAGTLALGHNSALGSSTLAFNGGTLSASGGARSISNNITLGGNVTIGGTNDLTFNGTINLNGGTRTITVNNTGLTTIAGQITEPWYSGLVKAGSGTLVLAGNNSYTAPTSVSAGTLVLAHNNALGANGISNHSVASGATLALQGGINVNQSSFNLTGQGVGGGGALRNLSGTNTLAGQINISSSTLIASDAGMLTLSGQVIADSTTVTVGGAGNTVLSGNVNGTGGTLAKTGTGTLTLSGSGSNSIDNLSIANGTVILAKSAGTNAIGGNGSIVIGDGSGGANSAILQLGASNQIPDHSSSFTIAADGLFDVGNFTESINTLAGTGNISLGTSGALTIGQNGGSSTFNGSISGGGSLTKAGHGTITLAGTNTYSGATNINTGTLRLGAANALSSASAVTIASGATLDFNGFAQTLGSLAGSSGTLSLGSGNLTTGGDNSSTSFGGTITGSGSLTKEGTGTFTLGGTNSYSGPTIINGGVLEAAVLANGGANSSIGNSSNAASNLVINGGTLRYIGTGGSTNRQFTLGTSGGTLDSSGSGAIDFTSTTAPTLSGSNTARTLTLTGSNTGNNYFRASLANNGSGATSLLKSGDGTWIITNSMSYTGGTTISAGTLKLGSSNRLANTGAVNVAGGTFDVQSYSDTVGAVTLSGGGTIAGSGTLTGSSYSLQGGTVNANLGGTATATVTSGTTTLNGSLGSTTVNINSGTLALGANHRLANTAAINVAGGELAMGTRSDTVGAVTLSAGSITGTTGTLTGSSYSATNATGTTTISANLGGTAALTKTGAGTLVLSGSNNTFSGGVTVNEGTLLAVGTTSEGGFKALGDYSSVVVPTTIATVNNGATLAVQNTTPGSLPPGTQTTQLLNISLSGTGADGGGALQSLGGRNTWLGNISLAGNTTIQNHLGGNDNTLFLGPYVQISPTTIDLNNNALTFIGAGDVYISSALGKSTGDTGSLRVNLANGGYGTGVNSITLAGPQNFYTGATHVDNGWLRMMIDAGNHPNAGILGSLTIGDGIGGANTAVLSNYYIEQIADNAAVTIKSDGLLDLASGSVNETLSNITLQGGRIATGTGNLFMTGTIAAETNATSTIDGNIGMLNSGGGPARIFSVDADSTLLVNATLFGGDYHKTGDGRMIVTSDSLTSGYNGLTTVKNGTLTLRNHRALGQHNYNAASSGTIVESGATLQIDGTDSDLNIQYESLTLAGAGHNGQGALQNLSGNNSWNNATITLADSATINTTDGTLSLGGRIGSTAGTGQTQTLTVTGSGNTHITGSIKDNIGSAPAYTDLHTGTLALTKNGSGTLTLSGANTFTGAININQGTLAVTATNVLGAQTNAVTVQSGATFSLSGGNNYTNTIGRLEGTGVVSIASATVLKVNNTTANTFDGRLSGQGLFDKVGSGTFTFSSTANTDAFSFDGTVRLSNGTLEFAGGSGVLNNSTDALFINTLELTGGTLLLSEAFINVGTLNITGDTILDFGATGHSILNADNIYIAAGKTLLIRNWTSEVDFLFANSDFRQTNGGGTIALFNQIGTHPQNQVHFEGDPQSPDGSHTTWINYDYDGFTNWEIRPIPEPSTYGAILTAASLAFLLYRRSRKAKSKS